MAKVTIISTTPTEGGLSVVANITSGTNTWSGPYLLDLPETATDEEIASALLTLYNLTPIDEDPNDGLPAKGWWSRIFG